MVPRRCPKAKTHYSLRLPKSELKRRDLRRSRMHRWSLLAVEHVVVVGAEPSLELFWGEAVLVGHRAVGAPFECEPEGVFDVATFQGWVGVGFGKQQSGGP